MNPGCPLTTTSVSFPSVFLDPKGKISCGALRPRWHTSFTPASIHAAYFPHVLSTMAYLFGPPPPLLPIPQARPTSCPSLARHLRGLLRVLQYHFVIALTSYEMYSLGSMRPLCCEQPENLTQGYYPRVDSVVATSAIPRRAEQLLR